MKKSSLSEQEVWTEREVAFFCRKTPRTLVNWRARGLLPYFKIGRNILYKRSSVLDAIARMERGGQ